MLPMQDPKIYSQKDVDEMFREWEAKSLSGIKRYFCAVPVSVGVGHFAPIVCCRFLAKLRYLKPLQDELSDLRDSNDKFLAPMVNKHEDPKPSPPPDLVGKVN